MMSTDDHAPPAARRGLSRGVYLLPSLLTIGNMLLGFYALVVGVRGDFQRAALLLFAAALVDGLDGRFARSSGTASGFGREYDSLADVITFGMVPALLTFFWGLEDYGRVGWLIPLFYVVCTATRLARFNVQATTVDRRYFVGLPAPAAAGFLGSVLFFAPHRDWRAGMEGALFVALVVLGMLMLSTFRYYSFKELDPRRRWSYRVVIPISIVVLLVAYHPASFFLAVSGLYAISGPLLSVRSRLRRRGAGEDDGALEPQPQGPAPPG